MAFVELEPAQKAKLQEAHKARIHEWIDEQVKDHATNVMILAQIEKHPPGYDLEGWALHLFDMPPSQLKGRLNHRVMVEHGRVGLFNDYQPPAVPEQAPAYLAAKMRAMGRSLIKDELNKRCREALVGLVGERSSGIVRAAQQRLIGVVREMTNAAGPLPYKVKVRMTKQNEFVLSYEEVTVR